MPSPIDEGIAPLIASSAVSALDWRGVKQVEEIWIPGVDGTFSRERYYRNGRWMEASSAFKVQALDADGHAIGLPLVAHAGSDDHRAPEDDGFTRRYSARQIASGCASVGNCAGTTFSAQALIQWRDALHPERDARIIPPAAASLRLSFDQLPRAYYYVSVTHLAAGNLPFGYGFGVALEPLGVPEMTLSTYQVPALGRSARRRHSASRSATDRGTACTRRAQCRSNRFGANVRNCSNCHLATPAGPARSLLRPSLH